MQDRVSIWLDPWSQRDAKGFQLVQSTFALAWGKITGTGLGLGDPTRIPEVKNDFIFAAFGEELGLLGGTALIVAYLLMVGSGLRIAIQAERTFEKLLATGLTTILGVQAFVIIGGVTRVVPLTGVTLPFVSYGGSSLLANYILLALLMRIADSSAQFSGDIPRRVTWRQRRAERRADKADAAAASGGACRGGARMNRQIRTLGVGLMVLFAALFLQLNVVQVVRADRYDADPANNRAVVRDFTQITGVDPQRRRRGGGRERALDRSLPLPAGVPDRATCSPTWPATSPSRSARRSSNGRRTTRSAGTRPSSSCRACRTCSTIRSTPATSSARFGPTSRWWPSRPSASATAASSCWTRAPGPSRRCGATRATTPT